MGFGLFVFFLFFCFGGGETGRERRESEGLQDFGCVCVHVCGCRGGGGIE